MFSTLPKDIYDLLPFYCLTPSILDGISVFGSGWLHPNDHHSLHTEHRPLPSLEDVPTDSSCTTFLMLSNTHTYPERRQKLLLNLPY